jgi:hypothetical protein
MISGIDQLQKENTELEVRGAFQKTRLDQLHAELQMERIERERLYELLHVQGVMKKES